MLDARLDIQNTQGTADHSVALVRDGKNWERKIYNIFLPQDASDEGDLFAFVPEFYINILPILLDTVMDFSFHDLNLQNDLSGKKTRKVPSLQPNFIIVSFLWYRIQRNNNGRG